MMTKPILLLDFDGVIHSYTSGWAGARVILDPPVKGALEFITQAIKSFAVCIYSSRSRQFGGKRAMKKWLQREYCKLAPSYENTSEWWRKIIAETAFADPWEDEVRWAAKKLVSRISFPTKKPAAFITIDDRCIQFDGDWSRFSCEELLKFKPWNKRKV